MEAKYDREKAVCSLLFKTSADPVKMVDMMGERRLWN